MSLPVATGSPSRDDTLSEGSPFQKKPLDDDRTGTESSDMEVRKKGRE